MKHRSLPPWHSTRRQNAPRPLRRPPRLEQLEDRLAPAVVTVTTAADENNPGDGAVSLREAITAINTANTPADPEITAQNPGTFGSNDTINFAIPGTGVQTINLTSALPALIKPVTINGYSQPGAGANTLAAGDNATILIELNGAGAGAGASGLTLGAGSGGSTLEGLAVNRFDGDGVLVQSDGNTVSGDFVGTDPAGGTAEPNHADGIRIAGASNNTVGGTTIAARDVVSGNGLDGIHVVGTLALPATGNLIEGDFVGTNAAGTGAVGTRPGSPATPEGNGLCGVEISGGDANTVGGATAAASINGGAGNVIGLNADGVEIDDGGQHNVIQGNFIGVGSDYTGEIPSEPTPVGNLWHGVALRSGGSLSPPLGPGQPGEPAVSGNVVGIDPSTGTGLGDVIANNGEAGVAVFGNPPQNNAVQAQNSGNAIEGNSIFANGSMNPGHLVGIDLSNRFVFPQDDGPTLNDSGENLAGQPAPHGDPSDPNNFQNYPVLTFLAEGVHGGLGGFGGRGTLTQSASPNTTFRIDVYASSPVPGGIPEGQRWVATTTCTTDAAGRASFSFAARGLLLPPGTMITATATSITPDPSAPAGSANVFNTSEFSPPRELPLVADPTRFPLGFGAGTGGVEAIVNLQANGQQVGRPTPFPGFNGEVRRATGDFNTDGVADVVYAAGPGAGPAVKVLDGRTGAVLASFYAFSPAFTGGVFVAAADVNGDGVPDLIVGAGAGGGPAVEVIDGTKLTQVQADGQIAPGALLASFYAFDPAFTGGVTVAGGDFNRDGFADIVVGAGAGGGPAVFVIDGTKLTQVQADGQIAPGALLTSFYAFDPAFTGGVYVAAGGFNDAEGPYLFVGAGAGGGPAVEEIRADGMTRVQANGQIAPGALLSSFYAYDPGFTGGVRVDSVDFGPAEPAIVTGAGPGGGPAVKVFNVPSGDESFYAESPDFSGGVYV